MSSVFDTLVNFVRKYENEPNSSVTVETRDICDQRRRGTITMKWWSEHRILFITHVQIESVPGAPKNVLSNAVKGLRNVENLGISYVKLVGVANSVLFKKLEDNDWYSEGVGNLSMSI